MNIPKSPQKKLTKLHLKKKWATSTYYKQSSAGASFVGRLAFPVISAPRVGHPSVVPLVVVPSSHVRRVHEDLQGSMGWGPLGDGGKTMGPWVFFSYPKNPARFFLGRDLFFWRNRAVWDSGKDLQEEKNWKWGLDMHRPELKVFVEAVLFPLWNDLLPIDFFYPRILQLKKKVLVGQIWTNGFSHFNHFNESSSNHQFSANLLVFRW